MSVPLTLLGLLEREPSHGYDLKRPAGRYLNAQRCAHLHRMRELTGLKRTAGLVDALLADHGLFHLEADLRWIDTTAARLDALAQVVQVPAPAASQEGSQ